MKASELRNKTVKDLEEELLALFKEQFNLRIQKGVGQSQNRIFLKMSEDQLHV